MSTPPTAGARVAEARTRIAPRVGLDHLGAHLQDRYGIEVSGIAELDLGVVRVDRRDGPCWVARVFPPARPADVATGDAAILDFLARHEVSAERLAAPAAVSQYERQSVVVTEFVAPAPRAERQQVIRELGGLRSLGATLGRMHALPVTAGAPARPGGAWHHLVEGGPSDELVAIGDLLADAVTASSPTERAQIDALRQEVDELDDGAALPEAFTHPDFVMANVVASTERGLVLVDWSGAGRGSRLWSLAWFLFAEGAKDLRRVDRVLSGYLRHIRPEPEELMRLDATARARPAVLAIWSYCLGRMPLAAAARGVTERREVASAVAARVQAVCAGAGA